MKGGGTVIFDTRDAHERPPRRRRRRRRAQYCAACCATLDIPELEPVPRDHVLTKTFYLLDNFAGRYATGQTWVEALPPARRGRAPPGARRRRRLADHHHLERPRRRLGGRTPRRAALPAGPAPIRASARWRSAAASTS